MEFLKAKKQGGIIKLIGLVAALLLVIPSMALALSPTISDGNKTYTLTDNEIWPIYDSSRQNGAITFQGDVGSFSFNITTGISKPISGDTYYPSLDLLSLDVSSSAGGSLTITLTDGGFIVPNPAWGSYIMNIGGTTSGTVAYSAFYDSSFIGQTGLLSGGAFSESLSFPYNTNTSPYSLTEKITITHDGAGNSSLNATLTVPEPGTLLSLEQGCLV